MFFARQMTLAFVFLHMYIICVTGEDGKFILKTIRVFLTCKMLYFDSFS